MAEARRAVEPFPSLTLEVEVDPTNHHIQATVSKHGFTLFVPNPQFVARNVFNSLKRLYNKMHQAFVPLPVPAVLMITAGAIGYVLSRPSSSGIRNGRLANILWDIDSLSPLARALRLFSGVWPILHSMRRSVFCLALPSHTDSCSSDC